MDFLESISKPVNYNDEGELVDKEEKIEEKVEEVEEKVEEKEEKVEEQSAQNETKEETTVETPEFSFDSFKGYAKEKFEKDIDSEDTLKSYLDKASEYDTLKTSVEELEQRKLELENLAKKVDGRSWFANDDEFVRQQFLKNSEGKFSESALGVLSNLSPEKVKKLSPIEAIKAQRMVDYPDMEKHEVEELVKSELGVEDFEQEEWDTLPKAKMKKLASDAKKSLSKLYDGIEIPKAVDYAESREGLKQTWNEPIKATIDGITKLELSENLAFDLTSEMKEGLESEIMNEILVSQAKPTEETLAEVSGRIRSKLLERNMDSVLKVVENTIEERIKAEYQKKVHNTSDLNESKRTDSTSDDDGVLRGRAILDAF